MCFTQSFLAPGCIQLYSGNQKKARCKTSVVAAGPAQSLKNYEGDIHRKEERVHDNEKYPLIYRWSQSLPNSITAVQAIREICLLVLHIQFSKKAKTTMVHSLFLATIIQQDMTFGNITTLLTTIYTEYGSSFLWILLYTVLALFGLSLFRIATFDASTTLTGCSLYLGHTRHSRLKGGNTHHFQYPLFFSFIDLKEIDQIGWSLWPIFKVNGGWMSFCSLDYTDHLRDWVDPVTNISARKRLLDHAYDFVREKTNHSRKMTSLSDGISVKLLAHLTYFGYCFNPISIFYFLRDPNKHTTTTPGDVQNPTSSSSTTLPPKSIIETMIVEVSNTPWIEQHCYMLDESIDQVSIQRNCDQHGSFHATWNKAFHVSPFMEMDYRYDFTFSEPRETMWVQSKMIKQSTKEVWFTASFELVKIPFTPLNLLYVLLYYPMHTRMIQVSLI